MKKNIETVNLTKCSNTIMADEIVSKLAEEGISLSLHDELDDPVYGAYGPNPGIEVRVCKKDFVQSLRILKEINEARTKQLPWCPNCGSENVVALKKEEGKRSRATSFIGVALIVLGCIGIFLPNFIEALVSISLYCLVISPFVMLGGILLVVPKPSSQFYKCAECGKKFKK